MREKSRAKMNSSCSCETSDNITKWDSKHMQKGFVMWNALKLLDSVGKNKPGGPSQLVSLLCFSLLLWKDQFDSPSPLCLQTTLHSGHTAHWAISMTWPYYLDNKISGTLRNIFSLLQQPLPSCLSPVSFHPSAAWVEQLSSLQQTVSNCVCVIFPAWSKVYEREESRVH